MNAALAAMMDGVVTRRLKIAVDCGDQVDKWGRHINGVDWTQQFERHLESQTGLQHKRLRCRQCKREDKLSRMCT